VQVSDRVIFTQKAQTYPVSANSISFGCNFLAGAPFTGRILMVETVSPGEILAAIQMQIPAKDGK
jgi:hypothetical protein